MKNSILGMVAVTSMIFAGSVLTGAWPAAAKGKCGGCHAVDKKTVGPSYMDIAAKYKGDADAVGKLVANITKGGSFGWKIAAMPPRGLNASDAEIKEISEYIAGLAK